MTHRAECVVWLMQHEGSHQPDGIRVLVMLFTNYQYCATTGTFVVLPAMPLEIPNHSLHEVTML